MLSRTRQILRMALDYGAILIFLVAALLLKGRDCGLVWGAAGEIGSLLAGVLNTWCC